MRKLVVSEWITLDGVFDSDEAYFEQWFTPFHSDERAQHIQDDILSSDAILYGRKTYEMLMPYWSSLRNNEFGIAAHLNRVAKYVATRTLKTAEWNNTSIFNGDVVEQIRRLKEQPGDQILISGSAELVRSLMDTDLIDEFRFLLHPIVLGAGKRFFTDGMHTGSLKLVQAQQLDLGVLRLIYQPGKPS
jgi:dihydrofolate reductase